MIVVRHFTSLNKDGTAHVISADHAGDRIAATDHDYVLVFAFPEADHVGCGQPCE